MLDVLQPYGALRPIRSKFVALDFDEACVFDIAIGLQGYHELYGACFVVTHRRYDPRAVVLPFRLKGKATPSRAKAALCRHLMYRGIIPFKMRELRSFAFQPELFE